MRFFPCQIWQVPTLQVIHCISACVYAALKSSISENNSLKSAYTHEILRFTETDDNEKEDTREAENEPAPCNEGEHELKESKEIGRASCRDRKSTRLNTSHVNRSRMPSSA